MTRTTAHGRHKRPAWTPPAGYVPKRCMLCDAFSLGPLCPEHKRAVEEGRVRLTADQQSFVQQSELQQLKEVVPVPQSVEVPSNTSVFKELQDQIDLHVQSKLPLMTVKVQTLQDALDLADALSEQLREAKTARSDKEALELKVMELEEVIENVKKAVG